MPSENLNLVERVGVPYLSGQISLEEATEKAITILEDAVRQMLSNMPP